VTVTTKVRCGWHEGGNIIKRGAQVTIHLVALPSVM